MSKVEPLNNTQAETAVETDYEQMADYLENILTRQLERLKKYDLDGAMDLAEQTCQIAGDIARIGFLSRIDFAEKRQRIQVLYREISLVIASEREEVAEKLKQIRKGMKTLGVYYGDA